LRWSALSGGAADARDAKIWILDPFGLNAAEGHEPITPSLDHSVGHSRYLSAITIPAGAVNDFADQVRTCGFRRADIYPDLANLAGDLLTAHPKGWASA
jgi:hypothetical protein